jgi:predicted DCC family thiol-disulfide oxidoreductase YuxK
MPARESRSLLAPRRKPGARQLVLYDGECGLCDRSVQFLLARDHGGTLSYAPLQGETAARLLGRHHLPGDLQTIVFVRDEGTPEETPFLRSDAALEILSALGGAWRLTGAFRILPRFLRDALYRWVAHNRYGWCGRVDSCRLPAPELRARFLP